MRRIVSAVRKWGGDGLFEAVGGWDNDLARDPPPRVSRSGRVLCAPSFDIYIISSLIVTNPVSVTWAGSIRHRSSEAAGWLWVGLGHVRRAAACPVRTQESAERSRAGGGCHLAGGSRRHPPHRACVLLCVLAVWLCGQVSRLRQAQMGCGRRAEWLWGGAAGLARLANERLNR